jgi:Leucine-rich repeat (LRR) protein
MIPFLVVLSVVVIPVLTDECPEKCFCNKQLTSVNCEGHKLTTIPDNLPKAVETLYMGHNNIYYVNLTGNGILPNLREIRLDNCKISGLKTSTFVGMSVPKLSDVYLRNNKISVVESRSFSNLSSLSFVYLTNNVIQKIQPDAFVDTPSVTYINLDSNHLTEIPSLGNLQKLQQLYIQANYITNLNFPPEYRRLENLVDIGLSNNAIEKLDDATFENLNNTNVRKIELSRNKLSEISKEAFVWFRNIQSLKIGWNPLTSSDLETAFYGLVGTPLTSLNIDNVTLDGHLPSSTFQLLRNTSIKYLSMKNNKMGNIPQRGFADLKQLLYLDLSASGIFTISETAFEGLDALNTLFLNDNQLSSVPRGLPPSLQKLYLNGNQITALRKNIFSNLSKLQLLYLGNNKISKLENDAFFGLTSLTKIHLVKNLINNLPGNIFTSFIVLESLELNKNNIQRIPNDPSLFSQMSSLLYLNLADNNFFTFPSGLFSVLPSLLFLHLENNRLGDLIADDVNGQLFAGLDKLVLLNLTNNQITKLPEPIFKDLSNLNNLTINMNQISSWGNNLYTKMVALENLDLSQNLIARVESASVKDLLKLNSLDLSQNPFACTCDLRWFRDWINTTKVKLIRNDTYLCNSPAEWHGKKLLTFDRSKINCLWFTETEIILTGAGGFVMLLIVIAVVYKKRWFIKLRLYRVKRSCRKPAGSEKGEYQRIDGETNNYDAYISCADDDYQWVLQNILPGIDNGNYNGFEFGGEFNLYFEPRDGLPGTPVVGSIIENMEASRVVLIVLTKEYTSKERYTFEIICAIDLLDRGDISDIIIVNVDGLTPGHVPRLLRRKMEKNDFIEWENSEEAKQTFKEELVDALRRKRNMENII